MSRTASFERGRRCEAKFVDVKFHEIRPPASEVDFEVQNRVLTPNKVHNCVQHVRIDLYSYLVGVRGVIIDLIKNRAENRVLICMYKYPMRLVVS